MITVGLTGGIASGKSTVSLLLKEKGAVIIDADKIAKDILKPDRPAWFKVAQYFSNAIIKDDGSIDRKKLGRIVFSDDKQLEMLNRLTHPYIIEDIKQQLSFYKQKGEAVIVLDAALLLELGLHNLVDEVWLVVVDINTQVERLLKREKQMTYEEAVRRVRAQMPLEEKKVYAHRIIDNNGTIEATKTQILKIWGEIIYRC